MNRLIIILIAILPFSHFLFRTTMFKYIDIWHTHGLTFTVFSLLGVGYMAFNPSKKPIHIKERNFPLMIFFIWLGLTSLYRYYVTMANYASVPPHHNVVYDIGWLLPFLNISMFILFYIFIREYIEKENIQQIIKVISLTTMVISCYAILQFFNLDQFYNSISADVKTDTVVGVLGNNSHLSGYLSMCLPSLYYIRNKKTTIFIVITFISIILTGSISGLISAILITFMYSIFFKIRVRHEKTILSLCILGISGFMFLRGFDYKSYISTSGRIDFWVHTLSQTMKGQEILGVGLGKLSMLWSTLAGTPLEGWKHMHNEFLQVGAETGIVGFILLSYVIYSYFVMFTKYLKSNELLVCLYTTFMAFIIISLFSYPAHLYLPSTVGMLAYAGSFAIKGDIS